MPIAELPQPLFGQMPLLDVMVFNRINHTAGTGAGLNINEGYRAYLRINRPHACRVRWHRLELMTGRSRSSLHRDLQRALCQFQEIWQRRKNHTKNDRARRPRPTPMTLSEFSKMALALIEHHEGRRAFPYYDSVGKISIGIGRNLADRGLSDDEISLLFLNDMRLSRQICQQLFVNFDSIAPTRQAALLSMAFNLGAPRLGKFHNMRAAIAADDWRLAAAEALDSKWARQLPARAAEIAGLLRG